MNMKHLTTAALLALASVTASAGVIDFESLAVAPGVNNIGGDRVSGGYQFNSSSDHTHITNNSFGGNSGSTFLVVDNNNGVNVLKMSQIGGSSFSLLGFDLGEWNNGAGLASQVTVTGNLTGGGTVQHIFTLDGIISVGGSNNFESFVIGGGWSNLDSVSFSATAGVGNRYWAIDNIGVGAAGDGTVPEPGSLALLGLGLASLAGMRRRKQ